jgi:hypothetical protein
MKKYIAAFFLWGAIWWAYEYFVDNFHLRYCYPSHWPSMPVEPVAENKLEQAREILEQPFFYLAKGRQFYAFLSQDGKYVLKLMKCQRFNMLPWAKTLQPARFCYKQKQIKALFTSCQIAADELSDVTGVLFVHLVPFAETKMRVTIFDKLNSAHELNLDTVPFLLQTYVAQGSHPEAQKLISLLAYETAKRGYIDTDSGGLERGNIGFVDNKAVYIDVGTFSSLSSYTPSESS